MKSKEKRVKRKENFIRNDRKDKMLAKKKEEEKKEKEKKTVKIIMKYE